VRKLNGRVKTGCDISTYVVDQILMKLSRALQAMPKQDLHKVDREKLREALLKIRVLFRPSLNPYLEQLEELFGSEFVEELKKKAYGLQKSGSRPSLTEEEMTSLLASIARPNREGNNWKQLMGRL